MNFKNILFAILLSLLFFSPIMWRGASGRLFAQNNMGIGTLNPHPSALLDLTANNKGLQISYFRPMLYNTITALRTMSVPL